MTPTERRYLEFLSPRTPRPKSCDRPGEKTIARMLAAGWIVEGPHRRFGPPDLLITPMGEQALDDAEVVDRGTIHWRRITGAPEGRKLLLTDGDNVKVGSRDGDAIIVPGYPPTSLGLWVAWADLPAVPMWAMVEAGAR